MKRVKMLWRCQTFLLVALALPAFAHAQEAPAKPAAPAVSERSESKGEAAKVKSAGQSSDDRAPKTKKKKKAPKHPTVAIGKAVTIDFTARIEGDIRGATPEMGLDDPEASWQSRRLGIQGTAFKRIDFEVSREVGQDFDTSNDLAFQKTAWRDVYADARVTKEFRVEAGHFKLPFGREELIAEHNLDFAYRSLAARVLSPGRDPGVMAHGRLFNRTIEYQAGYFTRDGSNARTSQTDGGEDARVARVVVSPFASSSLRAFAPLEIGAGIAKSNLDDRLGIRGRTVLGDGVFFDRVDVNGTRMRTGVDAGWTLGPVGVSTEYIRSSDQRRGMGFSGADLPSVNANAWYVAGTWALTGEEKKGRLEPHRDFLQGGFGAVELAARVETLTFGSTTFPTTAFGFPALTKLTGNADHVTTLGVNWYLNHYGKVQFNVIRESIDDPERSPAPSANGRFTTAVVGLQFRL